MSGEDKLNTAEHDHKGRCVRHPDIRLRKKKLLGGWKILIGHCPECCLDEMRRVRDEIEGGEKKKKKKERKEKKSSRKNNNDKMERKDSGEDCSRDGISLAEHETGMGGRQHASSGGRRLVREDGESDATGSTAQMSGGGSVVSEQYYREHIMSSPPGHYGHHSGDSLRGGAGGGYHHYHASSGYQAPQTMMQHAPHERTMVLSMAFIDPQTGQRGTYTGQINSVNHKPDGKGTVYYNNGTIAEGSWVNGILSDGPSEGSDDGQDDQGMHVYANERQPSRARAYYPPPAPPRKESRSSSRNRLEQDSGSYGNLHLLNALPGSKSTSSRGGSASVQSYHSRDSHAVSGSASVAGYSEGGQLHYGGSMPQYNPPQRGHGRSHRRVESPPTMNKRGEYEP